MKLTKLTILSIFLLAFVISVSARDKKPKIVWKNLQEKYKKYNEIEPVIKNTSDSSIYMFSDLGLGVVYDFLELYHLQKNRQGENIWSKVLHHGHPVNKKEARKLMSRLELKTNQENILSIDDESWWSLTDSIIKFSSFINLPEKGKGKYKYKFKLKFYVKEKKKLKQHISESPEFEITKEQKSFFDK